MKKLGLALATVALTVALPTASAFAVISPNSNASDVNGSGLQATEATSPQTGALDPALVAGGTAVLAAGAVGSAMLLKRELR